MLKGEPATKRELKLERIACDLVVVGGGMAGTCCAITAARAGLAVTLISDRPVLGGNASSEVRLWILGATSHMGNNNRWAREGGVIDEILVENIYRNPEGNPCIVDTILLEKVVNEPKIRLLLNTAVYDLDKSSADAIKCVHAFCPQNSTTYQISAPLFCDASGDGVVGFLAGAAFRVGTEASSEFGEQLAPSRSSRELLGHTIYFYTKDTGRPVKFIPPSFALKDITKIPRFRDFNARDFGCRLWWIEWGGNLETVHESETIKWELWKIVYGVWNHIKNSGKFSDVETLTLEWVGSIPGKRESRRFEGEYILRQQDIVEQRRHPDVVSYGGWAVDLHPADGVFSEKPGCMQWHSKGVFQIPYRCFYSRNIANLFLAGRIISVSHVAFGSTRVMATCAHNGQAVGMAAALCVRDGLRPRDLLIPDHMARLQCELLRSGQYLPDTRLYDPDDLAQQATLTASSELKLSGFERNGETQGLDASWAMMLPVSIGPMPQVKVTVDVSASTTLRAELRVSSRLGSHTPDLTLAALDLALQPGGAQEVALHFDVSNDAPRYVFVCLLRNDSVAVHLSDQRVAGVLAVCHNGNKAVTKSATQTPSPDCGIDAFEFWTPKRRPGGKNFALKISPPLAVFGASNLVNGLGRPTNQPNAWVADFSHEQAVLKLTWPGQQTIRRIELVFDTDYDHPMESVLMGHPERVMPFCVQNVVIYNAIKPGANVRHLAFQTANGSAGEREPVASNGNGSRAELEKPVIAELVENHCSRRTIRFDPPVITDCLELHLSAPSINIPAALFEVRCYET